MKWYTWIKRSWGPNSFSSSGICASRERTPISGNISHVTFPLLGFIKQYWYPFVFVFTIKMLKQIVNTHNRSWKKNQILHKPSKTKKLSLHVKTNLFSSQCPILIIDILDLLIGRKDLPKNPGTLVRYANKPKKLKENLTQSQSVNN